jgi:2-amino-4-hydroxy-6-hydroxymethyldihydropteridine diphosphokinase
MKNSAYIALGTNLSFGELAGAALLARAVVALETAGLRTIAKSSVWSSPAWPAGSDQPDYFNAVIEVEAGALSLYGVLRQVEQSFGRERRERWAARTLDLDVVAMAGLVGEFGALTLPHPRMHERAFVLAPLAEIAPNWRHPVLALGVGELLALVPDMGRCRLTEALP